MTKHGRAGQDRTCIAMASVLLFGGAACAGLSAGRANSSHQNRLAPDKHAVAADGK